jgi:hypothetical protein
MAISAKDITSKGCLKDDRQEGPGQLQPEVRAWRPVDQQNDHLGKSQRHKKQQRRLAIASRYSSISGAKFTSKTAPVRLSSATRRISTSMSRISPSRHSPIAWPV